MELKSFFAQDAQGNVIPNPTVYVYQPGATTLISGLQNASGGALTNPFTGAANGQIQVAAPGGDYDLRVASGVRDYTMRVRFIDTTSAASAEAQAAAAEASAANAAASANNAASAVVSQLNEIKSQTEYARDQAIAGLGAADNSQALAALLGALAYATDMALKGVDQILENRGTLGSTDRAELYALMFGELLDKVGVIGRAVAGGAINLRAGTAAIPSLASATDDNTGLFFPAADVLALATAGLERLRITADGRLGLGTTTPTGVLDVADNKLRVRSPQTPASATAAGNQGDIAWDASYVYVCVNTNTWRRAALSAW